MNRRHLFVWIILAAVLAMSLPVLAAEPEKADNIVDKSRIVVQEMMRAKDKEFPQDLLRQASGIAIIPGMIKGGKKTEFSNDHATTYKYDTYQRYHPSSFTDGMDFAFPDTAE